MDDRATIINVLKQLTDYSDIVRYCSTSKRIRDICIANSQQLFGKSYDQILNILHWRHRIREQFPSLEYHVSLDELYAYHGSYGRIWRILNRRYHINEIPMCRTLREPYQYKDDDDQVIDPHDPENLYWIAPYHKPILYPHRKLTFLFFRRLQKIPNSIFTLDIDEVITPYHFIQMENTPDLSDIVAGITSSFVESPENRPIWDAYIHDKMWREFPHAQYYPDKTLEEEMNKSIRGSKCSDYDAYEFHTTEITELFRRYFNLDHPVVEIHFNT